MIIAGARCDKCGRVDDFAYTSDTAVKVMLGQQGWRFDGNRSICPVCVIKSNESNK